MTLDELLDSAHERLLGLWRRQFSLEALETELRVRTRGKDFRIHDGAVWTMVLDHRDKNVIDFASWAKAAYSKGGFFGALQAHHLSAFHRRRTWGDEDELLRAETDAHFAEAHARWFPLCIVKPEHLQSVKDLFSLAFEPLLLDRSENRAHVYETGESSNARMLDLRDTRALYDAARDLLNDLDLIARGRTWALSDVNAASVEHTAEDVIDLVLLPQWARRRAAGGGIARENLFQSLHAHGGAGLFNDAGKLDALLPR